MSKAQFQELQAARDSWWYSWSCPLSLNSILDNVGAFPVFMVGIRTPQISRRYILILMIIVKRRIGTNTNTRCAECRRTGKTFLVAVAVKQCIAANGGHVEVARSLELAATTADTVWQDVTYRYIFMRGTYSRLLVT